MDNTRNFIVREMSENTLKVIFKNDRNPEFIIDKKNEKLLYQYNWNSKLANGIESIYTMLPDKSQIFLRRLILDAKDKEYVHFVTDDTYDYRECNLFKSSRSKKEGARLKKEKMKEFVPLNQINESTPTTNWRLGLKEIDSDKYMLWNLENLQMYEFEGTLSKRDAQIISGILNNINFKLN